MKTPPPIDFPEGGSPAERLDLAFRKVLTVPKDAILQREAEEKRERERLKGERNQTELGRRVKGNGPLSLSGRASMRKSGR
ncbi:MAG TPA: hypothetical protein VN736_05375 [Candidatus Limnocylindrales bacterium]|nr:hypothetical protein [Candidatus Limnocylindrales bacterium]